MKLSNKIIIARLILSILIICLLLFPFESAGIEFPKLFINELIVVNVKYLIVGILFIIALLTDYFDDRITVSRKEGTQFGYMLDSITNKILINSILIILSAQGFIHPIIPVVIIVRDSIVNALRVYVGGQGKEAVSIVTSKIKDLFLNLGIALTLFYNLPFELINIKISDILLIISTVLSVVSAFQYYSVNSKLLKNKA